MATTILVAGLTLNLWIPWIDSVSIHQLVLKLYSKAAWAV